MKQEISAVVLAGGKGLRAGGVLKTEIVIDGLTIFSRIENVLSGIFGRIFISVNKVLDHNPYDRYIQVYDVIKGVGPLGGIHASLCSATGSSAIFVFAGDMPFLDAELIKMMIGHYHKNPGDALIPRVNNLAEPLHGIYSLSILPELETYLRSEQKPSVIGFLKKINTNFLILDDSEKVRKAFTNINSPRDLFY